MSKILIFGKNGQVGSQLVKRIKNEQELNGVQQEYIALGSKDVDLSDLDELQNYLDNLEEIPSAVIDAAAYTAVDKAESEGKELNYLVNRDAPIVIAKYCKEKDIPFVYYTSDYVFDGSGDNSFNEDNTENLHPLNEYGKAKLEAEQGIQKIGGKYLIFRVSWVYNEVGKNFVHTMIRLASEREELGIIDDQIGSPTYAYDVANNTIVTLNKALNMSGFPAGIYHMVNNGYTNWNDFAKEIFKLVSKKGISLKINSIKSIKTKEYPTPAKRPLNSRLNTDKIKKVFNIELRSWQEALEECINKIYSK